MGCGWDEADRMARGCYRVAQDAWTGSVGNIGWDKLH